MTALVIAGVVIVAPWRADAPNPAPVEVRDLDTAGGAAMLTAADEPSSYRIVYFVEDLSTEGSIVEGTEVLTVDRPFRSRRESWRGRPPGQMLLGTEVSDFGVQQTGGPNRSPLAIEVVPGPAANDVRAAVALAVAIEVGSAEIVGMREVDGVACTVVRTKASLRSGAVEAGSDRDHTDSCLDGRGLVLEERQVAGGTLRSRRLAVQVSTGADAIAGAELSIVDARQLPVREGGGSVQEVTGDSRPPGLFFEAEAVPGGFSHMGRYAAVPPQPDFATPGQEASRQAGIVDVWTRGADALVVFQGSTSGGADPFAGESHVVDGLDAVEAGAVIVTGHGSELRIRTGRGAFLRMTGTVEPGVLVAVARSLRQVEGGTLTTVPD